MSIITYVLVGMYAVLTGLIGMVQWKENGFQIRIFLFVIVSLVMLLTLFIPNKDWTFILLIATFSLFHILAVAEGLKTKGQLTYSHHIIRFIFHCFLVFLVYKYI